MSLRRVAALTFGVLAALMSSGVVWGLGISTGDGAWTWQNPTPQGNDLHALQFADSAIGWAVGKGGLVLRTTDGGANWSIQDAHTPMPLFGQAVRDPDTATAVGAGGTVVGTADGGATWTPRSGVGGGTLVSVQYADGSTAYALGQDGLFRSTDGGVTWASVPLPPDTSDFRALEFLSPSSGYLLVGGNSILATVDRAATWRRIALPEDTGARAFQFLADGQTALVVGNAGRILKTTDGGVSWRTIPSPSAADLSSVTFSSNGTAQAVGDGGALLKSADAGESWALTDPRPSDAPLTAVSFLDESHGFVAGFYGTLLRTTDAGATWTSLARGPRGGLRSVAFVSADVGVAVGERGAIVKSADRGNTWRAVRSGTSRNLNGLRFVNRQTGFAVGDGGIILRSDDTGESWRQVRSPVGVNLRAIGVAAGSDSGAFDIGVIVGDTNVALRSEDQGNSWIELGLGGPPDQLFSVNFPEPRVGYIGGLRTIWQSTDFGRTWRIVSSTRAPRDPLGFAFPSLNRGFAVGQRGQIFRTNDGGTSWDQQDSHTEQNLRNVQFLDEDTGYVVGDGGTILITNNGGQSWRTVNSGTQLNLWSLFFTDRAMGFAVGDGGAVLKTLSGGLPTVAVPPAVESVTPANNDTDVVDDHIRVVFNKDIVFSGSVEYGESGRFQMRGPDRALVPATVRYDGANRQVLLRPTTPLAGGSTYTLTVRAGTDGVADLEGRRMVFTYGSRFRTACDISAAGGFGKLIKQDSGVRDRIGCANATESTSPAVEQVFERGHMLKRSNTGEILVTFFDDGHWASYADTFKTGDPEPMQRAPSDLLVPTGSFGKLWRDQSDLNERLGWAVGPERPFDGASQSFNGGQMVWTGGDQWLIRLYFGDATTLVVTDPNAPPPEAAGPAGFAEQGSYTGDCTYTPSGSRCLRFDDGYTWLVFDGVISKEEFGAFRGKKIMQAIGQRATYLHILGTNLVRVVPK